jgi:type III secretion protein T
VTPAGSALDQVLLLGIALARTAAAFALMPIFAPQIVPALIRNSLCVAFGLIILALQPGADILHPTPLGWITLFSREIFVGLIIGMFFGTMLWSFEAFGQILDAKIGPGQSHITDPFTGQSTSLNGALLGRLANFVFMLSGGLLLFVQVLLNSYVIWPITASAPHLHLGDTVLIEGEFARLMAIAIGFAAPSLVILTAVEGGMGLISRFAPQLNVFASSLSIKSWLATFIVLATGGMMVSTIVNETLGRSEAVLKLLRIITH